MPIAPPPPPESLIPLRRIQLYKRTVGGVMHSLLWYLWGIVCVVLGFGGGVLHGVPNDIVGALAVVCGGAGLLALIPLLLYRTQFYLRWWVRLVVEISMAILGVILFAILSLAVRLAPVSVHSFVLGSLFVLYGLATAFVAFW